MVKEKLETIMRNVFDDNNINVFSEMTADDVEEWDSLTHIDLIVSIESDFKIKLTIDEMIGLKDVGDMIELIEKKTSS
jgi:acyl carrier protein